MAVGTRHGMIMDGTAPIITLGIHPIIPMAGDIGMDITMVTGTDITIQDMGTTIGAIITLLQHPEILITDHVIH